MDFISLAPDYWDGPRQNRQYFCEELAKSNNKVMFVSPPFYVARFFERRRRREIPRSGTRQIGSNLWTHVPPRWLFTNLRFRRLDRLLRRFRASRLKAKLRQLGFTDPVLLVWHPQHLELIDYFPGCLVVYYMYDHISGYTGSDPDKRWPQELELMRRADLVFVVSRTLLELNRPYNRNIHHLPNAVDFDSFSKASEAATQVPEDLAGIRRPRIGYIGSINEKVDLDLLTLMARERPSWSIVLIGRQNFSDQARASHFARLVSLENVHWIPYRRPEVLPGYLKGLDVCLMCYVINGWTYYGYPSKMHEYLAAGKPTVGAPLQAILEFNEVIEVPNSHAQWLTAIDRCLEEDSFEARESRIDVARRNSYEYRVRDALELISTALADRRRAR